MVYGRSEAILTATAVFLGISLVAVILRCFVRLRIVKAFGADDYIMVVAMICNLAFGICGMVGSTYGMGKHLAYFAGRPYLYHSAMLCFYLGQIFYVVTAVLARLSIVMTLLRLFVEPLHIWILYGITALSIVAGLLFFFFTIFQCQPVNYLWDRMTMEGKCLDMDLLLGIVYMYSVVSAVCDFTIGILPVFIVWKLKMRRRTKTMVAGILGIGCLASTAVIVRIPYLHYARDADFLYQTTEISILSNVEASLGITAGCLMTLRPLLRVLRGSSAGTSGEEIGTYYRQETSHGTSGRAMSLRSIERLYS
ncbi:hypothetical protein EYZ11_009628 [Aspergillus tanneri]|uniref:Rhodopsin domain-containing protein n=1 Tax=Aspergillus tanneri TaxID=1220188 RepID=A0A4S3JCU0_9EURO|nr:uncharacterized protein ATNIH1004_009371 [Aspergillus tanneri]KAA8645154.1 hypothetical protein ATNIH1004_009371 [Aspergillus tanneri]THC90911.1 hypothetical protein EYZ11_009628 [Aspergillus tanneri]